MFLTVCQSGANSPNLVTLTTAYLATVGRCARSTKLNNKVSKIRLIRFPICTFRSRCGPATSLSSVPRYLRTRKMCLKINAKLSQIQAVVVMEKTRVQQVASSNPNTV